MNAYKFELLLYCGTRTNLFSSAKGSYYFFFSIINKCCEFHTSDCVILKNGHQSKNTYSRKYIIFKKKGTINTKKITLITSSEMIEL